MGREHAEASVWVEMRRVPCILSLGETRFGSRGMQKMTREEGKEFNGAVQKPVSECFCLSSVEEAPDVGFCRLQCARDHFFERASGDVTQ